MSNNSGITSLYPPVIDDEEVRLQAQAKADVMRRINVSPTPLPAAPKPIVDSESLGSIYKPAVLAKTKDELHKEYMEKEYGDKTIEAGIRGKIQNNKRQGRAPYEGFATHDMIIAENMKDRAKRQIKAAAKRTDDLMVKAIRNSSTPVEGYVGGATPVNVLQKNKKNLPPSKKSNGLDGKLMVDPLHPDGFRYTDVGDLYRQYGDNPERYIQEVAYLYDDGAPPTAGVVKPFNNLDSSSFPMNQKTALAKYGKAYNRLTPEQKKQVDKNKVK